MPAIKPRNPQNGNPEIAQAGEKCGVRQRHQTLNPLPWRRAFARARLYPQRGHLESQETRHSFYRTAEVLMANACRLGLKLFDEIRYSDPRPNKLHAIREKGLS